MSWRPFARPYRKVNADQAAALIDDGAVLVDVRELIEWREGHAPGARHIPLSQLPRRHHELPDNRHLVTVCRSGHRSARAAALLAREGKQVSNLAGGMRAWARAGLTVTGKRGRAGSII